MEAVPLRAGRAQCVSNMQQDMVEQTLAIIASMMPAHLKIFFVDAGEVFRAQISLLCWLTDLARVGVANWLVAAGRARTVVQ